MERKLIKQGLGGYTVYLPKKWIDKKGLKAGDLISISETDTGLSIGSHKKEKREICITLDEETRKNLSTIVTHIYRRGYDIISFRDVDADAFPSIKKLANDLLLGFEVTQRDATSCRIENLSEPTEEKFDVMLRRIFLIIKETHALVVSDLKRGTYESAKDIDELRRQQDKFILFCRRVLSKERYDKNPMIAWELLTFLMHIEHAYHYLHKYCQASMTKADEDMLDLLESAGDYFGYYYDAYFKRDLTCIHKINNLKSRYQFGICVSLMSEKQGTATGALSYIRDIFRLIQIGASPILSGLFENH